MKKAFLSLLLFSSIIVTTNSCSEDELEPVASVKSNISLTNPTGGTYVLSGTTATSTAFVLKFNQADFGYNASIKYLLQAVKSSDNFSGFNGNLLGDFNSASGAKEVVINQRRLNGVLLNAGGSIGTSQSYKIRVIGLINNQSSASPLLSVSNEVTITATAYDTFDEFDRIYVPGGYQGASGYGNDWSPDHANVAKLFSPDNNGVYKGFVWMNVATPEFKFTPGPAWTGDKGDANSNGDSGNLATPGNNIKPNAGAGAYYFEVNWNTNSYSMSKRQIAIIGAATPNGWGNPTYLTFDTNPASPYYQMYTIDLALTVNEFLIRLKDDWTEKFGSLSGNVDNVTLAGSQYKVKLGGGNMKIPTAGNYKVVLDIRNSANYNIRFISL